MTIPPEENDPARDNKNHTDNGAMDQSGNRLNESADILAHGETIVALCEDIAAIMPAPRRAVKQSIMNAVAQLERQKEQTGQQQSEGATHVILRADEGEWAEILPGIKVRLLFNNPTTGRTTYLARLEPGAAYPDHRHGGEEELLVLEGDLYLSGQGLYPGDYSVSIPDSEHRTVHSLHGCLCLVTSSMNDEFL